MLDFWFRQSWIVAREVHSQEPQYLLTLARSCLYYEFCPGVVALEGSSPKTVNWE